MKPRRRDVKMRLKSTRYFAVFFRVEGVHHIFDAAEANIVAGMVNHRETSDMGGHPVRKYRLCRFDCEPSDSELISSYDSLFPSFPGFMSSFIPSDVVNRLLYIVIIEHRIYNEL